MKKLLFLFIFFLLNFQGFSQVKVSLRVSPALAINRVTDADGTDATNISKNGTPFAFIIGPSVDFFFAENYAFSTGLWYQSTRIGGKIGGYEFQRSLQYIQAPITFKAFTNELATNMKLYFQLGGTFNVKINEKLKSSNVSNDTEADSRVVSPIDVGLYIGAGVNYQIAESNSIFAGLYYNRGLTNIITNSRYKDLMRMRTDLIGIEAGFTF